jgi:alcohol dehydrogenase
MAAVRSAGEVAGRDVLVMGTGVLGLIACALLRERGAFRVIACDLSPERRTVALSFGATDTCSPKELPKFVAQVTHGNGVDIGLDLSGSHKAVKQMIDLLAIGGVGVLVGSVFPSPTISLTPETVVRRLLTLRGVHNYTPTDLAEILRFLVVAQCAYPWNTLLADEYPLTAINEAITHAECTPPLGRIFIRPDA